MESNSNNKKKFVITSQNLAWGLTALAVICLSIVFYLVLTKMPSLQAGISKLMGVLMPNNRKRNGVSPYTCI